eukprot:jgi/Tetstr1/441157/TSEL_029417.t1
MNSKKRQNKKQDSVTIMLKKESLIGEECIKLVGNKYEELPEHINETYKTTASEFGGESGGENNPLHR